MNCPICGSMAVYTRLAPGQLEITCLGMCDHGTIEASQFTPEIRQKVQETLQRNPVARKEPR